MKPREALEQLVGAGIFPREHVDDLLEVVDHVTAKHERGELTEEQVDLILENHCKRVADARIATLGYLTPDEEETSEAITLALDAPEVPS